MLYMQLEQSCQYLQLGSLAALLLEAICCTVSHFTLNMRTKQAVPFENIKKCLNFLFDSSLGSPYLKGRCAGNK